MTATEDRNAKRDGRSELTPTDPGRSDGTAVSAGLDSTRPSDGGLDLLDGAGAAAPIVDPELLGQKEIAADWSRPLAQRLEAYEDIIESEIGDTNLTRSRNLEREVGLRQLYLKFEGSSPTGTQKDRIAFAQAMDALRRGFDTITLATCGNYGVAVAFAASMAGLRCVAYVPAGYRAKRRHEMEALGAEVVRVPGDYEHAVELSRLHARDDDTYDANPGGANTRLQLNAYGQIAYEVYDELRDAPAAVALPVSNGTTLAGVYRGFVSLYRRGKTSRIPRVIAGSSSGKNPIVHAFSKNLATCEDLAPEKIRETAVNEPLINWHAIDGDLALEGIRRSEGSAANASDRSMLAYARLLSVKEGLNVMPASTAGLISLVDLHRRTPLPGDRYVVILTGRRS